MNSIVVLTAVSVNNVNIFRAISDSDIVGLLCLFGCIVLSIISWAVILYKGAQLRAASAQSDQFISKTMSGSGSLEDAYRATPRYTQSPLAQILREAYLEMQLENWYSDPAFSNQERLTMSRVGLERVMERTITSQTRYLEAYLIFLATTSSVAPFIGLFGTVWGVLGAFQALGSADTAALQSLAPGLATALVATIAGLVAAIPASVFYNYYTSKLTILISRMDSFALELSNILQKRMIKHMAIEDVEPV